MSDVVNTLEVRVFGLQRSGNHAVLQWMMDQHRGHPIVFLNDVRHGDHDPYTELWEPEFHGFDEAWDLETIRRAPKRLLLYTYEDSRVNMAEGQASLLATLSDAGFEAHRERYLGASARRLDFVILRDPFNFFASRLRKLDDLTGVRDVPWIAENWTALARLALDDSGSEGDPSVVLFNRWQSDPTYRRDLSRRLGGEFSDATLNQVSDHGGGSSFDGKDHIPMTFAEFRRDWRQFREPGVLRSWIRRLGARGAEAMDVHSRWPHMRDDPRFRALFADGEMLRLSEALFGELPGTRAFVRSCTTT